MKLTSFFILAFLAVSGPEVAAKTFTIDDALGEFRPSSPGYTSIDVSLQELDGLPGYSRAEFKAAYDARVKLYESEGLVFTDYLPASFEEFYEQEIQRAKERRDIDHWYTEGLTVSTTSHSYFAFVKFASNLGSVSRFGDRVRPRSVQLLFDTPQDLASIDLDVWAFDPVRNPPYFEFTGLTSTGDALPLIAFDTLGETTLVFGEPYKNVLELSIRSGEHPDRDERAFEPFGLSFDRLVVREPSMTAVPIPAMFFPFMLAVLGLFGVRQRRERRPNATV